MQDGTFTLRSRFAWAHDFNTDRNIAATFQTLPGVLRRQRKTVFRSPPPSKASSPRSPRSYAGKGVVRYAW